jgi:hypothetical protein
MIHLLQVKAIKFYKRGNTNFVLFLADILAMCYVYEGTQYRS